MFARYLIGVRRWSGNGISILGSQNGSLISKLQLLKVAAEGWNPAIPCEGRYRPGIQCSENSPRKQERDGEYPHLGGGNELAVLNSATGTTAATAACFSPRRVPARGYCRPGPALRITRSSQFENASTVLRADGRPAFNLISPASANKRSGMLRGSARGSRRFHPMVALNCLARGGGWCATAAENDLASRQAA